MTAKTRVRRKHLLHGVMEILGRGVFFIAAVSASITVARARVQDSAQLSRSRSSMVQEESNNAEEELPEVSKTLINFGWPNAPLQPYEIGTIHPYLRMGRDISGNNNNNNDARVIRSIEAALKRTPRQVTSEDQLEVMEVNTLDPTNAAITAAAPVTTTLASPEEEKEEEDAAEHEPRIEPKPQDVDTQSSFFTKLKAVEEGTQAVENNLESIKISFGTFESNLNSQIDILRRSSRMLGQEFDLLQKKMNVKISEHQDEMSKMGKKLKECQQREGELEARLRDREAKFIEKEGKLEKKIEACEDKMMQVKVSLESCEVMSAANIEACENRTLDTRSELETCERTAVRNIKFCEGNAGEIRSKLDSCKEGAAKEKEVCISSTTELRNNLESCEAAALKHLEICENKTSKIKTNLEKCEAATAKVKDALLGSLSSVSAVVQRDHDNASTAQPSKSKIEYCNSIAGKTLVRLGAKCYYFSTDDYNLVNWTEAKKMCHTYGMKLVSIETNEEDNLIRDHLRYLVYDWYYWTSGRCSWTKTCKWDSTGQTFNASKVAQSRPRYNMKSSCVFYSYEGQGRVWQHGWCHSSAYYICEEVAG